MIKGRMYKFCLEDSLKVLLRRGCRIKVLKNVQEFSSCVRTWTGGFKRGEGSAKVHGREWAWWVRTGKRTEQCYSLKGTGRKRRRVGCYTRDERGEMS